MFCRNRDCFRHCHHQCINMPFDECDIDTKCDNVNKCCYDNDMDDCSCGFDYDEYNVFPDNPMYGQSYVPYQMMDKVLKPAVGLRNGTIFPELVSPYCPNQSLEEIEYLKANNNIGEGCNG